MNKLHLPGDDKKPVTTEQSAKPNEQTVLLWSSSLSAFLVISAIVIGLNGRYNWFPFLKPNEVGDFLAGFAGALAFIWIIAAILLQREELQLQRQELTLTRAETHRLADEAERQALALQASARTYFIQRWENALKVIGDIRIENAADAFLEEVYSHEHTKNSAKELFKRRLSRKEFSILSFERYDITRLYLEEKDFNVKLHCHANLDVESVKEAYSATFEVNIPFVELSATEIANGQNVPLSNFKAVIHEGRDLGLQAMMRDYDASSIIYPMEDSTHKTRRVRGFMTALIDELLKDIEN
ncbi:hypothetical protein [Hyphococcus sp.]|uniref:hypothetical protein n=1 Tax=Hyphococcus sp. TaxID=2038636 RepID=UPI0035C6781E